MSESEPSGICPLCGSDELDYHSLLFDLCQERELTHSFICKQCGAEGTDYYTIEFQETIMKEKKDGTQSQHQ